MGPTAPGTSVSAACSLFLPFLPFLPFKWKTGGQRDHKPTEEINSEREPDCVGSNVVITAVFKPQLYQFMSSCTEHNAFRHKACFAN